MNSTKTIEAAAKDRTVIFISHRLSTTRMADRIYLFDGGKITEQGSHEELMKQDGTYAKMFRVQAKKYQDEEKLSWLLDESMVWNCRSFQTEI